MTNQYLCIEDPALNQFHLERSENLKLSSGTSQSTLTYPWKHEKKDIDSLYWSNLDEAKIGEVIRMNNEDYTVIDAVDLHARLDLFFENPYSVLIANSGYGKDLQGKWRVQATQSDMNLFDELTGILRGPFSQFEKKNALRTILKAGRFRVRLSGL